MARTKALPRPSGASKTSRKSLAKDAQQSKHQAERKQQIGGKTLPRIGGKRPMKQLAVVRNSAPGVLPRKPVKHSGVFNYRHRFQVEMKRQQKKGDHDLGVHNTQAQRRMIGYAIENARAEPHLTNYVPSVQLHDGDINRLRMKKDAISAVHDAAQDSVLTITERAFRIARMQGLVTLKPCHLAQAFWSWSADRNPELWNDAEHLLKNTSKEADRIVHSPQWFGCTPNAECFDIYTKGERARLQRKQARAEKKAAESAAPTAVGVASASA